MIARALSVTARILLASLFLLPSLKPTGVFAQTYVQINPPAAVVETVPAKPGPGYVWVPGYYRWNGVRYVWVPGHWVLHEGAWCAGHWVHVAGRGWHWVAGRWC
jgi:hypothetical protein